MHTTATFAAAFCKASLKIRPAGDFIQTSTSYQSFMQAHKNKTLASFLAFLFGGFGIHRFYLGGRSDLWGWLHLLSLPASGLVLTFFPDLPLFFGLMPLILSTLVALLETLIIGLTPDEKWDAKHNPASGRTSASRWPLALLLVLTAGVGATALIATIARTSDLLLTGGSFG